MSSPISRVLSGTVIHLGPASPQASSNLPESSAGHAIGFLFGLAPGGVYHRRELLPVTRCALTAPFHPYRCPRTCHGHLGGILSVALSVGSRRPGVTWHLALRSPDFPPPVKNRRRLSGELGRDHTPAPQALQGKKALGRPSYLLLLQLERSLIQLILGPAAEFCRQFRDLLYG